MTCSDPRVAEGGLRGHRLRQRGQLPQLRRRGRAGHGRPAGRPRRPVRPASAPPRSTTSRSGSGRSPSRPPAATPTWPTPRTRSPPRSCWSAPTRSAASRSRSSARRTPTTTPTRRCPATGRPGTASPAATNCSSPATAPACGPSPTPATSPSASAGLIGNWQAIGEDFHITSDESLTWDEIYGIIARTEQVEPRLVAPAARSSCRRWPPTGSGPR